MNCKAGIPFYPASYASSEVHNSIGIGCENGDLLFLAFNGLDKDLKQASLNLKDTLKQTYEPIQEIAEMTL